MSKHKMKLFFILMLSTVVAHAQNGFILDGQLKDINNEPVPFAHVSLSNSTDTIVTGVASNINGHFEVTSIKEGVYSITIQFVGYETWRRANVLINRNIHLGSLVLNESTQLLNEIVVRGEALKSSFEVSPEGISINPSQNLANIGGSALDILRNTPSISVDGDGAITLRGSSATNVLINGRNSSLAANLDHIPASAVKSIKVINNPGAKYDASAKGGIINIELKKGEGLGTHGNIDATLGTNERYNGSFKLSHQTKDYRVYSGYDLRRSINNGYLTATVKHLGMDINLSFRMARSIESHLIKTLDGVRIISLAGIN